MNEELSSKTANRLALGLARQRRIHYRDAEAILRSLTLRLVIDPQSCRSVAFQAALLTAFNTGNRAFLGGVSVEIPADVELLLPLPGYRTLDEALQITGFQPHSINTPSQTIYFGHSPINPEPTSCRVDCDGWRGAVSDFDNPSDFRYGQTDDIAPGGVLAGAFAVHRSFLKAAGISARSLEAPLGLSLWSPGDDWRNPASISPLLHNLPNQFWVLGLGHLGQAFLWNLALLPYPKREEVRFLLQDFDTIETGNFSSGLLCNEGSVRRRKTRHCAGWLDDLGFQTTISERKYTEHDRRTEDDPKIALCGFDRGRPRSFLGKTGFDLIVECGLGDTLADFDQIHTHTFPSEVNSAEALWGHIQDGPKKIEEKDLALFTEGKQACGQIAIDMAGKAVSTSFVGAMAGALVVAELLRVFNGGQSIEEQFVTPRNTIDAEFRRATRAKSLADLVKLGFTSM
ncbi:MAG: hypothetical protein NTZ16_11100 [Verrucomicrobia bacterium]|nr:hypothetical protein [Verrucomicrobiota bacterium]